MRTFSVGDRYLYHKPSLSHEMVITGIRGEVIDYKYKLSSSPHYMTGDDTDDDRVTFEWLNEAIDKGDMIPDEVTNTKSILAKYEHSPEGS